jgi:glycosyltransferase involved in cell wall biosynthesis
MTISAIIITKNAEHYIQRCLESVQWMDEIVVLDSGSTDRTIEVCKKFTDKVFQTDWPGFGIQKNRALDRATSEWVFSIDSDEWLSEELKQEIQQTIQRPSAAIFSIPRRTKFIGKFLYHGDPGKDRVLRLFKKGVTRFSDVAVHENLLVRNQKVEKLKNVLFHESYRSVEELLERMNRYSSLSALMRVQKGKKGSLTKAITHGLWAFIKTYVLRAGFLDGKVGFIVAVTMAESSYYRYVKMMDFSNPLHDRVK